MRRCTTSRWGTGSWFRSTSAAARAGCATGSCTASARPPRTATRAPARACSATAALRAGPGRPGRAAARAVRRLPARQGPRRPARRPVPVPVRRAAHRVAGGGVRRGARRRHPARHGRRSDRRHGGADRRVPRAARDRRGPGARASLPGRRPTVPDHRPGRSGAAAYPSVRDLTEGRGADSVVDAVGMEAHGSPLAEAAQKALALLPKKVQGAVMTKAGIDRLDALYTGIEPSAVAGRSPSPACTAAPPTRCR